MTKRQENALKTKQKLLDAATDFITKGNFDTLKVEDITKACGCAKGTFYVYFKNKDEISNEICRNLFNRIAIRMEQMKNQNFTQRMEHYFISFMQEVERYGINICREWIKSVIDPKSADEDWDNSKWQFDVEMLGGILSKAVKNGELKKDTPVVLLTHIIICELYGMMTCWCMSDGVFEPTEHTSEFFKEQIKPVLNNYLI
ncbi:MAG: TetR/AcrR family transcriptional regulator [Alphaproteobacteria bacterium]|nr:TetR/AcrR family transcriptional regulator [Alphaproteobacteria bacterium]